jgi:hypothetical protein
VRCGWVHASSEHVPGGRNAHDSRLGEVAGTPGTAGTAGEAAFARKHLRNHRKAVLSTTTRPDPDLLYPPYSEREQKMLRKVL